MNFVRAWMGLDGSAANWIAFRTKQFITGAELQRFVGPTNVNEPVRKKMKRSSSLQLDEHLSNLENCDGSSEDRPVPEESDTAENGNDGDKSSCSIRHKSDEVKAGNCLENDCTTKIEEPKNRCGSAQSYRMRLKVGGFSVSISHELESNV